MKYCIQNDVLHSDSPVCRRFSRDGMEVRTCTVVGLEFGVLVCTSTSFSTGARVLTSGTSLRLTTNGTAEHWNIGSLVKLEYRWHISETYHQWHCRILKHRQFGEVRIQMAHLWDRPPMPQQNSETSAVWWTLVRIHLVHLWDLPPMAQQNSETSAFGEL